MKSILNFLKKLFGYQQEQTVFDITLPEPPTPRTDLSVNVKIKVNGVIIGAIQSFTIKESKDSVTGECGRIRFDKQRISEVFTGKLHVCGHPAVFDIEVSDPLQVTIFKNCSIEEMTYTYHSDDWIITEWIKFKAESVSSTKVL
jgi:hypothetical protein